MPFSDGSNADSKCDLPCGSCPWRMDRTAADIPNYSEDLACGLVDTVGEGDAFRKIMACHHSTDENMRACNGYLAREGWSNLNVRMLLAQGKIMSPTEALEACENAGINLHENYHAVLDKLKRTKKCQNDTPGSITRTSNT